MKVPSQLSPKRPSTAQRTIPVDRLFAAQQTVEDSYSSKLVDSYYKPIDKGQILADVLVANKALYRTLVSEAVKAGEMSSAQGQARQKDFESGKLGPHGNPAENQKLKELENEQFCLLRHPQQTADGLYRKQDYYVSAGTLHLSALAQGWETSADEDGQQLPVADVVVIGAGPGGLTTAWQTARRGGRVVCFESELAGSAFSDAGAKAVHTMRTSADGTNLVQEGHALATLDHPLSLHGNLAEHRRLALQGQTAEAELTGVPNHGVPAESKDLEDRNSPATRGELFEHLARLSHSLATGFDNAYLCERSPVNQVTFKDGLFTISSTRGHKVKAKNLVLATGLTGPSGQHSRMLNIFDKLSQNAPQNVKILGDEKDVSLQAESLGRIARSREPGGLVVHDRLLGQQAVRQSISALPDGTRAAVVGSGESAIKACLEIIHLNPGISVDLFCKNSIEAAQTQLPNENFHTAVLENTMLDPSAIEEAKNRAKLFGTPVTPRSLLEMLELQQSGRLRIVELGDYFCEQTVSVQSQAPGQINIGIKDASVQKHAAQSHQDFANKALLPAGSKPFQEATYGAVIQAVGYKKQSLSEHPLMSLPPAAHQKMHFNTAGVPYHPAETSLAGLSVRGRQLAETLAQEIPPERRIEITVPQDSGIDWREVDRDTVAGIIKNRGLHPGFVRSLEREIDEFGSHPDEIRLTLPSSDSVLRDLNRKRIAGSITVAEREVLERALRLSQRMSQ